MAAPRTPATPARTPLMAGNWKMNLDHQQAVVLVQKLAWTLSDKRHDPARAEVVVVPPFTDLRSVQTLVDGDRLALRYGAQDVSTEESGAFTGEVSASMLAKLGCSYVVVGHSERREHHHESDEVVAEKARAALGAGMTAIVCLGEPEVVREGGTHVVHCCSQLTGSLAGVTKEQMASVVVAYEPVWAIGTGQTATPQDAQEVCGALRAALAELYDEPTAAATRILYGGSMKPSNTAELMAMPDVDGGLVGGASLDADQFAGVVRGALPAR